jgi:hypothetical protein
LQPVTYEWRVEEYPQFRFSSGKEMGLLQAIRELKAENDKLQAELKTKDVQWEERFRAQEERASVREMQEQMAALEASLARVESRGGSNQTSSATREAE